MFYHKISLFVQKFESDLFRMVRMESVQQTAHPVNTYVAMIPCGLRFYNLTLEYKPDGQLKHSIEIFEHILYTDM